MRMAEKIETCSRRAICLYIYRCTQWHCSCCSASGDWWQYSYTIPTWTVGSV